MSPALLRLSADTVVVAHAAFVAYAVLGGLCALRWRWTAWVHVPAAIWAIAIEFGGWVCPLTPLENSLRQQAGLAAYEGDFIARYLLAILYPANLTRTWQVVFGLVALLVNAVIYWRLLKPVRLLNSRTPNSARA